MPQNDVPWHHWPIAALAMVFYTLEVLDSALTKLGVTAYMNLLPDGMDQVVAGLPVWIAGLWAVGVWAGLAGAYLLWKCHRYAVLLLLTGAVATALVTLWMTVISRPSIVSVAGMGGLYLLVGGSVVSILIYIYARWERTQRKLT